MSFSYIEPIFQSAGDHTLNEEDVWTLSPYFKHKNTFPKCLRYFELCVPTLEDISSNSPTHLMKTSDALAPTLSFHIQLSGLNVLDYITSPPSMCLLSRIYRLDFMLELYSAVIGMWSFGLDHDILLTPARLRTPIRSSAYPRSDRRSVSGCKRNRVHLCSRRIPCQSIYCAKGHVPIVAYPQVLRAHPWSTLVRVALQSAQAT